MANNTSVRRDQTGFIDNSLYLEALVGSLLSAIPRVYSDDEEGWGDEEEEEEEGEVGEDEEGATCDKDQGEQQGEPGSKCDGKGISKGKSSDAPAEKEVEAAEMPKKRRKVSQK